MLALAGDVAGARKQRMRERLRIVRGAEMRMVLEHDGTHGTRLESIVTEDRPFAAFDVDLREVRAVEIGKDVDRPDRCIAALGFDSRQGRRSAGEGSQAVVAGRCGIDHRPPAGPIIEGNASPEYLEIPRIRLESCDCGVPKVSQHPKVEQPDVRAEVDDGDRPLRGRERLANLSWKLVLPSVEHFVERRDIGRPMPDYDLEVAFAQPIAGDDSSPRQLVQDEARRPTYGRTSQHDGDDALDQWELEEPSQ